MREHTLSQVSAPPPSPRFPEVAAAFFVEQCVGVKWGRRGGAHLTVSSVITHILRRPSTAASEVTEECECACERAVL